MSEAGTVAVKANQSNSFAVDMGDWLLIMEAYEYGGHAYDAAMPINALTRFCYTAIEMQGYGFEQTCGQAMAAR